MRSLFTIATLTASINAFGQRYCNNKTDCGNGKLFGNPEICVYSGSPSSAMYSGECVPAHHNEVEENNSESFAFGRHDFDDGHWGDGYEHGSQHRYTDFDTHLYDQVPEGQ